MTEVFNDGQVEKVEGAVVSEAVVEAVDSERAAISQMVCISVHGKKFLIGADLIADFPQGILDSLRVVVEGDHKFERGSNLESIMDIAGGFKRRVQGLVDLRRRVEREYKLARFNRRSKRGSNLRNHQEKSSVRRSSKDMKNRGFF